jgi:tRNA(Ile)-lysidine synthase
VRGLTARIEPDPTVDLTRRIASALDARLERDSAAPLAVALSGGGDSVALLALASAWAERRGRRLLALGVDHGLQAQSPAWMAFAAETARRFGVAWRGLAWAGQKPSTGLPAAARAARHALIADAAREAGAAVVLFAHTHDDVAEGEVMRAEGSNLGRLQAWAPSPAWPEGRGVFLLRPLLDVSRAELRAFLRASGLDWIEDPANDDPRFARTRARARLGSGAIALETGPTCDLTSIRSLALQSATDDAGVVTIARAALRGGPAAAPFLRAALLCASGGTRPARGEAMARLIARLTGEDAFTTTLSGARIEADEGAVRIFREAGETARGGLKPVRVTPGRAAIWDGRFEISGDQSGEIRALKGLAARLPDADRLEISRFAPAARPCLPVWFGDGALSPFLASSRTKVRSLTGARLAAACGVIAHEREIAVLSRGEGPGASLCCA